MSPHPRAAPDGARFFAHGEFFPYFKSEETARHMLKIVHLLDAVIASNWTEASKEDLSESLTEVVESETKRLRDCIIKKQGHETGQQQHPFRLTIVEGNIGIGKTTWIGEQLERNEGANRIHVVPEPLSIWQSVRIPSEGGISSFEKFYREIGEEGVRPYIFVFEVLSFATRFLTLIDHVVYCLQEDAATPHLITERCFMTDRLFFAFQKYNIPVRAAALLLIINFYFYKICIRCQHSRQDWTRRHGPLLRLYKGSLRLVYQALHASDNSSGHVQHVDRRVVFG